MMNKNKVKHFVFGAGGAIVVVGAAFKILHLNLGPISGSAVLGFGMAIEALLFMIDALDFSGVPSQKKGEQKQQAIQKKEFAFLEDNNMVPNHLINEQLKTKQAGINSELDRVHQNLTSMADTYEGMLLSMRGSKPSAKKQTVEAPAKKGGVLSF